ncbi:OmpA family protein [Salinisphaera sp. P385]|uniref:OmpA family protein n=1 Tax=Spectribacter acetivorans TaxID=3075603 RepID=A0ABU3BA68_9GAMM|nr:OmpA family protein [Salinisphaera sp. P385]MDT0618722.1 OmpA family protein [Salinisphaera sp. P385]
MRLFPTPPLVTGLGLLLGMCGTAWAQSADVPAPGAAETVSDESRPQATYDLIIAPAEDPGGIDANLAATRTVDGPLSRRVYRSPADQSPEAVLDAMAGDLREAGFEIVFRCADEACGGPAFLQASPGGRHDAERFILDTGAVGYLAARDDRPGGDRFVAVQSSASAAGEGVFTLVDVIDASPRELSAITVDAEEMGRRLDEQGRVALYGIYFDTDSARLRDASDPTLTEIGKLMRQRPDLRLLVVGHTDTRGELEYNIDLSRRRAEAVVEALVGDQDVTRGRLKPWGVGFTSPAASNSDADGRSRNRRVELVVW